MTMRHRALKTNVPTAPAKEVDRLDRPRGWSMKAALEQSRHELTLEGLAEVDEGRTLAHEEVRRWASGLKGRRGKTR